MTSGTPIPVLVVQPSGAAYIVRVALLHRIETEGREDDPIAHLTDARGVDFLAAAVDVRMFTTGLVQLTVELRDEVRRIREIAEGTTG